MATQKAKSKKTDIRVTTKERAELLGLDGELDAKLDVATKTLLAEAGDLLKVSSKEGAQLLAGTDLAKGFAKELERRTGVLQRAEDDWDDERTRRAARGVAAARKTAVTAKKAAMRALRYFLRQDAEVQARLAEIAEGSGDADLVDDCRKLANLVDANDAAVKKAKLGTKPAQALRTAADALSELTSDKAADTEPGDSIGLRNRAFWYLRELMDEIRDAGRYVFSDDPRRLLKYRSTLTLARSRRRAKKATRKPAEPTPA